MIIGFVELLYKALEAEFGIEVQTDDPKRCREKLYAARRDAKNPDFAALSITPGRLSPNNTIWIIKTL